MSIDPRHEIESPFAGMETIRPPKEHRDDELGAEERARLAREAAKQKRNRTIGGALAGLLLAGGSMFVGSKLGGDRDTTPGPAPVAEAPAIPGRDTTDNPPTIEPIEGEDPELPTISSADKIRNELLLQRQEAILRGDESLPIEYAVMPFVTVRNNQGPIQPLYGTLEKDLRIENGLFTADVSSQISVPMFVSGVVGQFSRVLDYSLSAYSPDVNFNQLNPDMTVVNQNMYIEDELELSHGPFEAFLATSFTKEEQSGELATYLNEWRNSIDGFQPDTDVPVDERDYESDVLIVDELTRVPYENEQLDPNAVEEIETVLTFNNHGEEARFKVQFAAERLEEGDINAAKSPAGYTWRVSHSERIPATSE